ncbi:quinone oxidoreductase protein [Pleurostoma richardsiae]|uniref:Quinone oxidoreductase protein n=1 Tax=Pleurostoma richardsiae TaxID=41990 RepID=A0AA38RAS8_9PEZI|nr:quinone oxidoreductase protein [Pleurostoma richardsiae]
MSKMRAIGIKDSGTLASALILSDTIDKPAPGRGEVLVKVRCFGVTRTDLTQRSRAHRAGSIPGVEFSGTVEGLPQGSGVDGRHGFQPGDEVFGLAPCGGAYAEYVAVPTRLLARKPPSLSWEDAAGVPEAWMATAQALFETGGFERGVSVLWHAGASPAVAAAGIQMSAVGGASPVYATAGSAEEVGTCRVLGAREAWDERDNWVEELKEATAGKGVDIIVDFTGQEHFQKNLNSVAVGGRLVLAGMLSGGEVEGELDLGQLVQKRVRVEGSGMPPLPLGNLDTMEALEMLWNVVLREALPRLTDGSFRVPVERVFDWREVGEAHNLMETGSIKGKIVCQITMDET